MLTTRLRRAVAGHTATTLEYLEQLHKEGMKEKKRSPLQDQLLAKLSHIIEERRANLGPIKPRKL